MLVVILSFRRGISCKSFTVLLSIQNRQGPRFMLFIVFLHQAALIMQVLQLTPEQISMLPDEQRQSILALKDQLQSGRP